MVFEYPDYLVIKTPTNPTFFWGNLLYFKSPPTEDSMSLWKQIFEREFRTMNVEHMTFAWDSPTGEAGVIEPFLADGFDLERSSVMTATEVTRPLKYNDEIVIRPVVSERDWQMVLENQVNSRGNDFSEAPYRKFASRKIHNYRLMIQERKGVWMGAFLGEQLVGDLGIFFEDSLARFQNVGTHPNFRRLGICSTLIYETFCMAKENMGVTEFVIVADPDYHAANVYESLGFNPSEKQIGICKFNKQIWAT